MFKFERPQIGNLFSMNSGVIRKNLFLVTLVMLFPFGIFAQKITMEQTLDYINGKLGTGYSIEVNRGIIIAKFNEGTEPFREDQVLYKSLDLNTMRYDKEQRMFIINCKAGKECVDRQLFIKKIQRDYGRFSLPVSLDAKGVEGMKNAFRHMMKLIDNPKDDIAEPFEP